MVQHCLEVARRNKGRTLLTEDPAPPERVYPKGRTALVQGPKREPGIQRFLYLLVPESTWFWTSKPQIGYRMYDGRDHCGEDLKTVKKQIKKRRRMESAIYVAALSASNKLEGGHFSVRREKQL